jgi:hypothetical protein
MISPNPSFVMSDYKQYAIWLLAMLVATFGFRFGKGIIAFVLDKLYQFFIQNNVSSL